MTDAAAAAVGSHTTVGMAVQSHVQPVSGPTSDPPATPACCDFMHTTEAESSHSNCRLPVNYTLAGCKPNIPLAGEQLIALLDLLHAPDQRIVQLNACINALCRGQQSDEARVSRFWYNYSQLQVWVKRRVDEKVKGALEQLLANADINTGG